MRLPFQKAVPKAGLRHPLTAVAPEMPSAKVAALYRAARVGGDFFDFATVGASRLLLLLLDIAGERTQALHIAAAVQDVFRGGADLMLHEDVNEAVALPHLLLDINHAIMTAAGGVRHSPAFLACFNEALATFSYVNAGHTSALLRDQSGITVLSANGLPLGLFSHATHDAQISVLAPGSALLLVSRGLVEVKAGGEEFGLERVQQVLERSDATTPQELCAEVLDAVRLFVENAPKGLLGRGKRQPISENDAFGANDATALALVRHATAMAAGA
jgi:serine phosphatase RsbU (regulator of sigma subunit)